VDALANLAFGGVVEGLGILLAIEGPNVPLAVNGMARPRSAANLPD
jgi:hypothetical protein